MFSIFLAIRFSLCRNDEQIVRGFAERMEIGWRASPRIGDEFADATLIDAHAAIHPVDLAALRCGEREQGRDLILGRGMVFFGEVLAVHRVRMRRLPSESQTRCALKGEYVDVVSSTSHSVENAK